MQSFLAWWPTIFGHLRQGGLSWQHTLAIDERGFDIQGKGYILFGSGKEPKCPMFALHLYVYNTRTKSKLYSSKKKMIKVPSASLLQKNQTF